MTPLGTRLPSVAVPTLVIAGALDPTGARRARAIAAAIPGARLEVIDGVGHSAHRRIAVPLPPPRPRLPAGGRRMTAPVTWTPVVEYEDIRYEHSGTGHRQGDDRPARGPQRVPARRPCAS